MQIRYNEGSVVRQGQASIEQSEGRAGLKGGSKGLRGRGGGEVKGWWVEGMGLGFA